MATLFTDFPQAESSKRIDFTDVDVRPGIVNDTWILIVSGTKPFINMEIQLLPRVYVRQPEYWGIEVVGTLPGGIGLPATAPYSVPIPLAGIIGTDGIEVIGATRNEKRKI